MVSRKGTNYMHKLFISEALASHKIHGNRLQAEISVNPQRRGLPLGPVPARSYGQYFVLDLGTMFSPLPSLDQTRVCSWPISNDINYFPH